MTDRKRIQDHSRGGPVLGGWLLVLALAFPWPVLGQTAIVVDTRLMLLAHPTVHQFDPAARKFRETSSEPVADGEAGVEELKREIARLRRQVGKSLEELSARSSRTSGKELSRLEKAFLEKRKALENKISRLETRLNEVTGVPGQIGQTGYSAIVPQVNAVSRELRAVLLDLAKARKAETVIDISSLAPLTPGELPPCDFNVVSRNLHAALFFKRPFDRAQLKSWLQEAKNYWPVRDFRWVDPVPFGAVDLRNEAAQMTEKRGPK